MYQDGSMEIKPVNQEVIDNQTGRVVKVNDLSSGTYDVVCKAGPSFRNQQEQTLRTMLDLAQIDPSVMELGGDLLLKNVVSPVADSLAERRRAQMLAQGIIPESQMTDEEKQQMQMKAQAAQGQQPADPNMILAQAEMLKAQADMQRIQNDQMKIQLQAKQVELEQQRLMIDGQKMAHEARISEAKTNADLQKASDANLQMQSKIAADIESLQIDKSKLALESQKHQDQLQLEYAKLAESQQRLALDREKAIAPVARAKYNRRTGMVDDTGA
jgi:hypothetical protein